MNVKPDYKRRLALLKSELKAKSLDAILVTNEANVAYLSGFFGHDCLALITLEKDFFLTDSRYIEEAENTLDGFRVQLVELSTYDTISEVAKEYRLKKIGFEAMDLAYGVAIKLYDLLKSARLEPCKDIIENLRAAKDTGEVALIRESARINKLVFDDIAGRVVHGMSEKYLAGEIEAAYIHRGARPAFEPIVASGENSSKPHAVPSVARIKNNSFVMIDIGAKVNGYCSDLTRMAAVGRIKSKSRKIYDIVKAAQAKAIDTIRPGVKIRDVDNAARGLIRGEGFGKYFSHSLGHGIGLDVHEKPTISGLSEGVITAGMIFTIEPAVYIPGFGGVRIEDMVLVTDNGCEVITR